MSQSVTELINDLEPRSFSQFFIEPVIQLVIRFINAASDMSVRPSKQVI